MLKALLNRVWRGPSPAESREAGMRALRSGDLAEASRLLESAVREAPGDPDAAFHAGLARHALGEYRDALAHFERCIVLVPTSADAYHRGAAALNKLGDVERARSYCEKALALTPSHLGAREVLSRITLPGPIYTHVLRDLHQARTPGTYVEIGIGSGMSLEVVQPSTRAVAIDPQPRLSRPAPSNVQIFAMESDAYFAARDLRRDLGDRPVDLGFIDGSHLFEQTMRDFINVERCATPDSTIVLHDAYPLDRMTAERTQGSAFWSGDVWRLVLILKKYRPDLTLANVATAPTGLCIVRGLDPSSRVLAENHDAIIDEFLAVDYSVLDNDKAGMLNLVPNEPERVLELVRPHAHGAQ